MSALIGRAAEISIINEVKASDKPAFVAVYGRRRVGKTYLIRQVFGDRFSFYLTGMGNVDTEAQLANFMAILVRTFPKMEERATPPNWFQAFQYLIAALEQSNQEEMVIFLDELPWLDTPGSDFVQSLEHFWNSWANLRQQCVLVVCGSAASWMMNKLIMHHGGLHNRVTHEIKLEPFTLQETELMLQYRGCNYTRYQVLQVYMAIGGIPFYLDMIKSGKSATQNINDLCFKAGGQLRKEFDKLYASLFRQPQQHIAIVQALSTKLMGLERTELLKTAKIKDGGTVTRTLNELEESGFIRKYPPFGKAKRPMVYQLCDFYTMFYLRFIKQTSEHDTDFWINSVDAPEIRAWSGYAFEQVCLAHLPQIKKALGISAVQTQASAWIGSTDTQKAQIDLVIDRRDQVINLCEMKFSMRPLEFTKSNIADLQRKVAVFQAVTQTNKALFLTLISPYGVLPSQQIRAAVQNQVQMDALFELHQ
jgi:uncharacterized protein